MFQDYYKALEDADEKVQLANQIYDLVSKRGHYPNSPVTEMCVSSQSACGPSHWDQQWDW